MFIELNEGGAWDYWLPGAAWADYHVYHFTILLPPARSRHLCTNSITWQKSSVQWLLWLELQITNTHAEPCTGPGFFHQTLTTVVSLSSSFSSLWHLPWPAPKLPHKTFHQKTFPKTFSLFPIRKYASCSTSAWPFFKKFHEKRRSLFCVWDVSVLRWTQFRSAPSAEKPQLFHKIFVPDFTFSPVNIASQ